MASNPSDTYNPCNLAMIASAQVVVSLGLLGFLVVASAQESKIVRAAGQKYAVVSTQEGRKISEVVSGTLGLMHDAYIAGLIDGEGSIMLLNQGKGRSRRPEVAIGMIDENVIDALIAAAGGFKRTVVRKADDRQTMYHWRCSGGLALDLLDRVRPYLVMDRRRALADVVSDYCRPKQGSRGPGSRNARADRLTVEHMRELNAKRRELVPSVRDVPKRNPSDSDMHYLAGILDGEGYVSFEQRRIEVWSTDPELLSWLASRFGGGVYRAKAATGDQRTLWRWLRRPTGCAWAAGVADYMLLGRKADELRRMQDDRV